MVWFWDVAKRHSNVSAGTPSVAGSPLPRQRNSDDPGLLSHQDVGWGLVSNNKHHDIHKMKTEVQLEKKKIKGKYYQHER